MATKPLKAAKPAELSIPPTDKSKSTNKTVSSRQSETSHKTGTGIQKNTKTAAHAAKVTPAMETPKTQASNTKPVKKTPTEVKTTESTNKSSGKATEAKQPVAKKSTAKQPSGEADTPVKATLKHTDVQPVKEDVPAIEAKAAPAASKPVKQVIVPNKPAINPKQVVEKKTDDDSNKPVVIPKTSTSKMVDYEPDFIKSVLDTPLQERSIPTMRYSDAELNEFRELINKKLEAAKKELAYLQGLITRKDEMGGDESDNRYMTMEDGSMSMEREQLSQMASRQITFIDHLEKAIMRIENKTYGICRVTGKLIDKARLRAVPHATLSMEAKLGIVK